MENNIDLFITAYKPFQVPVTNENYKIIIGNHEVENKSRIELIQCKYDSALDDKFYSEIYMYRYLKNNYPLKDYVGFCHYRKYFNFLDNIPNLDEIFSNYDCIVGKPIVTKMSCKNAYVINHNIEDLYIIGGIIADKYPSYVNSWHNFINGNIFIPYNMFIMKKDDFKRYIDFIFGVLDEYVKIVGTDIKKGLKIIRRNI